MWQTFRRWILIGSLSVASIGAASESAEVNLDYVAQRALDRARAPFHSPHADLPAVLRPDNLDYDKFRQIEYRQANPGGHGLRGFPRAEPVEHAGSLG